MKNIFSLSRFTVILFMVFLSMTGLRMNAEAAVSKEIKAPTSVTVNEGSVSYCTIKYRGDGISAIRVRSSDKTITTGKFMSVTWKKASEWSSTKLRIKGRKAGKADMVFTLDGDKPHSVTIHVTVKAPSPWKIKADSSASVTEGQSVVLPVQFWGSGISSISAESSDQETATVSVRNTVWNPAETWCPTELVIKGIKTGSADITFSLKGLKPISAVIHVTVKKKTSVAVTGIKLSKTKLSLEEGKSTTLTASISPSNATNKAVIWSSSNSAVASVSSGKVTAKKAGTTVITAVSKENSSVKAACTVTVTAKKEESGSWSYPMTKAYVCGNNWRTKYNKRRTRPYHVGLDLASRSGDKNVYAASSGTVAAKGFNADNGYFVILKHKINNSTVYSFYCHLKKGSICVKKGASISKGKKLAVYGDTGSASRGVHLHFAVVSKLSSGGSYFGYVPYFTGNKTQYNGITYYNPAYVIKNNKLP